MITQHPRGWQVDLRAIDYDHEAAAIQSERQGRPDWADALHSGRVGRFENCGKTALFSLLTGARQKVTNYAGVPVERKVGTATLRSTCGSVRASSSATWAPSSLR